MKTAGGRIHRSSLFLLVSTVVTAFPNPCCNTLAHHHADPSAGPHTNPYEVGPAHLNPPCNSTPSHP